MPGQEPVVARFLGWRDKGSLGEFPQTSVSSVSTDDGTNHDSLRKGGPPQAIWSDDATLERTDGFDFGSWWEDYAPEHEHQPSKLSKAEVVRPKVPPVAPPVPSLTATCPAGLLEALEAMQRGEGVVASQKETRTPGVTPVSPGRRGRSPWIGPRKPRAPLLAELAALELEASPGDAPRSISPLPAATEVEEEEALMALADLSGSEILRICRGNVPSVQKALERQNVERAWQRTRVRKEEAQRGRKRAAHFRRKAEKEVAQNKAEDQSDKARTVMQRLERRHEPIKTVSTRRLSLSILKNIDETQEAQDSERRFSLEEDLAPEEQRELSERSRRLRKKIREATLAGIREKKKHVDRMHRKRRFREGCWKALPHSERFAIEAVFKLHCNACNALSPSATLDALRDIGLRGRTMVERNCVEKAVNTLVRDLLRVEEEGMLGAWGSAPEGEPQIWWRSAREISALPAAHLASSKVPPRAQSGRLAARASIFPVSRGSVGSMPLMGFKPGGPSSARSSKSNDHDSTSAKDLAKALEKATPRPTGIPLEAFGAEVMPCARWELFGQRTEPHFRLFVQEMETSRNPSGISYDQFQHMISEMGLDKAKGPLPPAIKGGSQKIGPETCMDLEMVHIRLLQLEERAAREAAAREWAIAKLANVNDQLFRQYRHELLWIYDMFNSHDEEHCGSLGEFEVRRLMKYMGLEPYFRHYSPEIEKLIKEVDANRDDEIELTEFLSLVGHVRKLMMKLRKSRVSRCFLKADLDATECLAYDQIVAALAQDGLLRTRGEYAIAHKLLDEEFDLSFVLRAAARSEGDSPGPPSPRNSRPGPSPTRRRQRALLMEDPGSVDLNGFSIVYQRVWERLAAIKGERVLQAAKALNFSMLELSDIQAAFDHFDSDQDGLLIAGEIIEALEPLLPRLPDEQQLRKALPAVENPDDEDDETIAVIDIFEFMRLLRTLTGRNGLVHINKAFSLANDVPFEKQQELLQVWPISESYIQSLDASELIEMLSNFLGVKAEQNLRELSYPVSSFRKLRELALRQAERAQQHTRF